MARYRLGDVVSAVADNGERYEGDVVVIQDDGDDPEPYLVGFPAGAGSWALDDAYQAREWLPESSLRLVRRDERPTTATGPAAGEDGG